MVDKDMLSALSELLDQKFDEKLEPVYDRLDYLDEKVDHLDEKVDHLEGKVDHLDEKVDHLEGKVDHLEGKVDHLDEKVDHLEGDMTSMKERMDQLESSVTYIRVAQLENNVIPRLNTIESYYVATSQRYMEKAEQIDAMSADIVVLQHVVEEHSQKLNQISG